MPGVARECHRPMELEGTAPAQRLMNSRFTHPDWYPFWQFGHVLSEMQNDPMTNCPGFTDFTALPTSSTIPQYSCPIGVG